MSNSSSCILASLCILAATSAQAETIQQNLSVSQGKYLLLDTLHALRDDCSPGPLPQMNVKQMPANGQLRAHRPLIPVSGGKNCTNVDARSLVISYVSYPNFTGTENITANIIMPNGNAIEYKWTIKVTPRDQKSAQAPIVGDVHMTQ